MLGFKEQISAFINATVNGDSPKHCIYIFFGIFSDELMFVVRFNYFKL